MIRMILAVDQGGAIGWVDGRLAHPNLKADMKRFKELTTGHIVVMGFNTFKSLNRPTGLPNRKNIVLSRKNPTFYRDYFGDNIDVISNLDYIERLAKQQRCDMGVGCEEGSTCYAAAHGEPDRCGVKDIWIIGGASVYEEALRMDIVDEIYLTLVHADSQANVRMDTDLVAWKRFVLTERRRGVEWEVNPQSRQWDCGVETSYIHFKRIA